MEFGCFVPSLKTSGIHSIQIGSSGYHEMYFLQYVAARACAASDGGDLKAWQQKWRTRLQRQQSHLTNLMLWWGWKPPKWQQPSACCTWLWIWPEFSQNLLLINMTLPCLRLLLCYCMSWGSISTYTSRPAHFASCDLLAAAYVRWIQNISEWKWSPTCGPLWALETVAPILKINEKHLEQLISHCVRCSWWFCS